jgi:UDP-N-acetylmuramoyl-tripeptide--D-alanyl-D-alanine ligase
MSGTASAGGVSIDSRTIAPGDVFYALRGERQDGHDYVAAALAAGASRAVIARAQAGRYAAALAGRLEAVEDPLAALQERARAHRRAWGKPLIAVTGSAGKTTTKDMIAAVLGTRYRVLKTEGNFNNHIGLPLTLLRLGAEHDLAVAEMGMNHAGEIARLAEIAEPNVGVFTNVGAAHLGNFGSIEEIAEAKRELARAVPANGTLILNADDRRVAAFGEGFGGRVIQYTGAGYAGELQFPGAHNRANAAAALATGALFGLGLAAGQAALGALAPAAGRGQWQRWDEIAVLDDTYNANPEAMARMLAVLAATPARRRIAVLGEMRELGASSAALHRELGEVAARSGLDALWAVAGDARHILEGARAAGFAGPARFAADAEAAAAELAAALRPGDAVLFKASRGVRLEAAIQRLRPHFSTRQAP